MQDASMERMGVPAVLFDTMRECRWVFSPAGSLEITRGDKQVVILLIVGVDLEDDGDVIGFHARVPGKGGGRFLATDLTVGWATVSTYLNGLPTAVVQPAVGKAKASKAKASKAKASKAQEVA